MANEYLKHCINCNEPYLFIKNTVGVTDFCCIDCENEYMDGADSELVKNATEPSEPQAQNLPTGEQFHDLLTGKKKE
jgi:hypothetical protein